MLVTVFSGGGRSWIKMKKKGIQIKKGSFARNNKILFFVFFNLKTFLKNNSSLLFFPPPNRLKKDFRFMIKRDLRNGCGI